MNTVVTSKETILENCREIVAADGIASLSMRGVAETCHVALGSLYNYFPSKDDLVMETIESVWQNIFQMQLPRGTKPAFPEYVRLIDENIRQSAQAYPNFLTAHSVSIAGTGKSKAKNTMEHYLRYIKEGMLQCLKADALVNEHAFFADFTSSDFVDFVLANLLTLLIQPEKDSRVLYEMIRRAIYFH